MDVSEIIERLGGPKQAAQTLGQKRTTVSMWKKAGRVPACHVWAVARALGVAAEMIRPDLADPQPQQEAA